MASYPIKLIEINKITAFSNEIKIDDFLYPYVYSFVDFDLDNLKATIANANPATSKKLCPASESKDNEFICNPITICMITYPRFKIIPVIKALLILVISGT